MYKQGDILLIPIPFTDLTASKKRPVLVLSNSLYNKTTKDIVVVAITSNLESKEYAVLFSKDDMKEGTLKVDSCIRADKIYTLSQDIIVKKFGSINDNVLSHVKEKISLLL